MPSLRFLIGLLCGDDVPGDDSDLRFRGPTGAMMTALNQFGSLDNLDDLDSRAPRVINCCGRFRYRIDQVRVVVVMRAAFVSDGACSCSCLLS